MTTATVSVAEYRKQAKKRVPEADVQCAILGWLRAESVPVRRINTTGVQTTDGRWYKSTSKGTPDLLGWLPWGMGIAIEVKRPSRPGSLRYEQAQFMLEVAQRSPWTMLLIPTTLAEVREILEPMLKAWRRVVTSADTAEFWALQVCATNARWRGAREETITAAMKRLARGPR